MGFPVRAVFAVLWTTQLIAVGLVGVSVYQQHLLLESFRTISEGDSTGRNREESAKFVAPGGEPIYPGTLRPVFEKPLGTEKVFSNHTLSGELQTSLSLNFGLVLLFGVLVLLLAGGRLWTYLSQGRHLVGCESLLPGSPSFRQELARRQLAEVRLRRHGFGQ